MQCLEACVAHPRPRGISTANTREGFLEQQNEDLKRQVEELREQVRELQEAMQSPLIPLGHSPPMVKKGTSRMLVSGSMSGSTGSLTSPARNDQTDLAAINIAAAAESAAEYQRSLVNVTIDNESHHSASVVTVRAPSRKRLLADMSACLTGLGCIVVEASIQTSGWDQKGPSGSALTRFCVQEADYTKVHDPERLEMVKQRLQQRFCGEQGLNGGVNRLLVERFIRAVPPWEHIPILSEEPSAEQKATWLKGLTRGLQGSSSLGLVSNALAARLAEDLLLDMTRMQLPRGGRITNEQTQGEWILLLEGRMPCMVLTAAPGSPGVGSPADPSPVNSRPTSSSPTSTPPQPMRRSFLGANGNGGRLSLTSTPLLPPAEDWLEEGTMLWELVTDADAPLSAPLRSWSELRTRPIGEEPAVVRGIHLSTARSRLVALRESLARQQRYVLADTPVFAPLSASKLLTLCRRGKLVDVPAGSIVLAADSAALRGGEIPETIAGSINHETFGLVLSGELQVCYSCGDADPTLPAQLPLARLGKRDTFGEVGALARAPLPAGVSLRSESGATLLTWERDKFLLDEISMMVGDSKDHTSRPSLLECSWRGRTPLSLLTVEPKLLAHVKPVPFDELIARERAFGDQEVERRSVDRQASEEARSSMMLVTEGEIVRQAHKGALVELHQIDDPTLSTGQVKLGVRRAESHSLNDMIGMRAFLMEQGLQVSDGNFSLESSGQDAFEVTLPAGDPRTPDARIAELRDKIHKSQSTVIRTGASMLCVASDGLSRFPRLAAGAAAPSVAMVDLPAFGTALAADESSEIARLWRLFVDCNAKGLLPPELSPPENVLTMRKEPSFRRDKSHNSEDAPPLADPKNAGAWHSALCAFNLFRLRDIAGQEEVGVTPSHLELGLKLGEGGYGVVHMARHRVSGALYAVKSFTKTKIRRMEEKETYMRLERERKTLKLLATELRGMPQPLCAARLICSGQDKDMLRLVMPACLGGDLQDLMESQGKLSDEHVQFYSACVVLALKFLHELQIAYRDLKPENVMLDESGWPVLIDFGLVSLSLADGPATSMVGTPEFMAPEIVDGSGHNGQADMWSLGVMMCELLTGTTPFADPDPGNNNHQKTYANILQGKFTKQFTQKEFKRLPKRTAEVIEGLLQVDAEKRLGIDPGGTKDTLRIHPFFWGLSWDALENRNYDPPHAEVTKERASGVLTKVHAAPHTPLPRTGTTLGPVPHRSRNSARVTEDGQSGNQDAAASAMDKLFDFSEW